ncbi:Exportin-T [Apostasia shenzhenica]|uniref:Exportin-T n=1 Tax=Apostasia shenzhenica TaxID=1088818 RepID=A0A2I0A9Y7_9ASPA|nr:Exportin-T [Apostasia shenzhenica]
MDDFERAILLVYESAGGGAGGADQALLSQAIEFCDRLKAGPPSALIRLCLDRLHCSPLVPVQFWCIQSIHDIIRLRYSSLSQANDLPLLRSSLLSLFSDRPLPASSPPFLKNKLAQALAALIRLEYPSSWDAPFIHFVSLLPAAGAAVIDMFSRLLTALDDDLISQDYHLSPEDVAAATCVKDAMRLQCVPQIVRVWFEIVSLYRSSDPVLAAATLDTMRRYICWIDIGLVANDAFLPLLFDLMIASATPEPLRAASAGCVLAVVSKRMDPHSKISLLRSLGLGGVFADVEMVPKLSDLVIGYASEALECYKRLGSELKEASSSAMVLLEEALPSVFYVVQNCEELDSGNVVQFLSDYISTLNMPSQKQTVYIGQILEVIRGQISYDPTYRNNLDIPDNVGKEQEDQMAENRKDLLVLFRSVCRVAPDVTQLFIRNLITGALSSSEVNVEEVEAALTLFYRFGETVSEEGMKTGSGLLREMVPLLLSAKFSCHSHRLVALVYLETITRYMKFVQENGHYIPNLLAAFLDERGIHHPNLNVSRRASYLFMRAVKLLKAKLVPFIDTILQSLLDVLNQYATFYWTSKDLKYSGFEDGSHAFEAIGLLIGVEDVVLEKQSEYLAALLKPLCQQVEKILGEVKVQGLEESSPKVMSLQQIIVALNALSKPKDMVDFLLLINQVICKFGTSVERIMEEIFPKVASRLTVILSSNPFSSGLGSNTEELRELQELQRVSYAFIHVMVTHDISSVFIAPNNMGYLDSIMQLLLLTSCSHKDVLICVQIFVKLTKDWCSKYNGEDKVPGFRRFIIEKFATYCCLYSVLDKSFDFRDANTLVLFGEIVLAQKVMHEKLGDDFIVYFVLKGLPTTHCPQDLAEQYYQRLRKSVYYARHRVPASKSLARALALACQLAHCAKCACVLRSCASAPAHNTSARPCVCALRMCSCNRATTPLAASRTLVSAPHSPRDWACLSYPARLGLLIIPHALAPARHAAPRTSTLTHTAPRATAFACHTPALVCHAPAPRPRAALCLRPAHSLLMCRAPEFHMIAHDPDASLNFSKNSGLLIL